MVHSDTYLTQVNMTTSDLYGSHTIESAEWELVRSSNERNSIVYACCPERYVDIRFKLTLRRRPTFASHLFVAPSVILCLITPTVYLLPPACFEKLTLGKSH